jgi:hypothetical protein
MDLGALAFLGQGEDEMWMFFGGAFDGAVYI